MSLYIYIYDNCAKIEKPNYFYFSASIHLINVFMSRMLYDVKIINQGKFLHTGPLSQSDSFLSPVNVDALTLYFLYSAFALLGVKLLVVFSFFDPLTEMCDCVYVNEKLGKLKSRMYPFWFIFW